MANYKRRLPYGKKMEKFSISVNYFTFASRFDKKWLPDGYRDLGDVAHPEVSGGRAKVQKGDVAQLVEQRTENPCVGGSIPSVTTKKLMLA